MVAFVVTVGHVGEEDGPDAIGAPARVYVVLEIAELLLLVLQLLDLVLQLLELTSLLVCAYTLMSAMQRACGVCVCVCYTRFGLGLNLLLQLVDLLLQLVDLFGEAVLRRQEVE